MSPAPLHAIAAAHVPEIGVREVTRPEMPALFPGIDDGRLVFAFATPDERGRIAFGREGFDTALFGVEIGRIHTSEAASGADYRRLSQAVLSRAYALGYQQVLRRVPAENLAEIWALEATGFELMDVGVTFARRVGAGPERASEYDDLQIAPSTDADLEIIVRDMVRDPWGSRFEADPAYRPDRVRELRSKWLLNSHRGRAAAFFVGTMDGQPAGYVTCLLDEKSREADIELVGTLPAFRGRKVASRILAHTLAWLAGQAELVKVRTQSTNVAAAALYERAGFTLHSSDLTFRAALSPRRRRRG